MSKKNVKENKLYSIAQVSEMLGLAPTQIQYRIKTGQLRAEKIGWFWTISASEVERFKDLLLNEE